MESSLEQATALRQKRPSYAHGDEIDPEEFAHITDPKARRLAELIKQTEKQRETSGVDGFKRSQNIKIKGVVSELLAEGEQIEDNAYLDEAELFFAMEDSFYKGEFETEIDALKARHQGELKAKRHLHEQEIAEIKKRNYTKKQYRESVREMKNLFMVTQDQEQAFKKNAEIKETLKEFREKSQRVLTQLEERHRKQIQQFVNLENRRVSDQKILNEVETRHLPDDQRAHAVKEFESRLRHQRAIDKKRLDQVREMQRLEVRHTRDKSDFEARMIEDFANIRARHCKEEMSQRSSQRATFASEKERVLLTKAQIKLMEKQTENQTELRRLQASHRVQFRQTTQSHKANRAKRVKYWSAICQRDVSVACVRAIGSSAKNSQSSSQATSVSSKSGVHSTAFTRGGSNTDLQEELRAEKTAFTIDNGEEDEDENLMLIGAEQTESAKRQLEDLKDQLEMLSRRQEDTFASMKSRHNMELKKKEEEYGKQMLELEWQQEIEIKDLKQSDEEHIHETMAIQQREMEMDAQINSNETRQLQERKVLGLILDGLIDAVISIDVKGKIIRFNASAEKFWGYKAEEVIGSNVKMLMPSYHASEHDEFLYNYLSSGVKKVVDKVRTLTAKRKDGSEFPIDLSVTEIIEDGTHLFNAMIRDLTAEREMLRQREAEEDCLPQMIWKVDLDGNSVMLNKKFQSYTGLGKGNVFDPAIVHPDDLRKSLKAWEVANLNREPFETKRRLKSKEGTYKWFLTRGAPIFDRQGENVLSWYGSCTDVDVATKLQVEAEALPEALPQALWKSDIEGNVLYANSHFMNYIGARKFDGINVFSPEIIHMDDIKASKAAFDKAVDKGTSFEARRRIRGTNGMFKWFLTRGSPLKDEDGNIWAFYGTCTDIHEETLQSIEMAALPESLPQLVWKVDPEGNVKYANKKFMKFSGATDLSKVNVFSDSLIHPDDYKASNEAFAKGKREKGQFTVERRLKGANGKYQAMKTIGVPILDEEKNILGWYGTCTEI